MAKPTPSAQGGRKKRRGLRIKVAPEDREVRPVPLAERARHDLPDGGRGLAVSLALHALILFLFWATLMPLNEAGEDLLIELGFSVPKTDVETPAVRAPIKLESVKSVPDRTVPKDAPDDPQNRHRRPVRPVDVENMLQNRSPRLRGSVTRFEGAEDAERAVNRALRWLRTKQLKGGNWQLDAGYPDPSYPNLRTDTGATALALLAYLGAGHTHLDGPFDEVIDRGLKWLVGIQKRNGDLHDHVELGRQTAYYAHSQATIVLCEALAMTGDESLREPAERAVKFLLDSQHPTHGGWRYRPQSIETSGDLSVTGWALMALNTARMANIDVPDEAFFRTSAFIDSTAEQDGALYKYQATDPPERVSVAMTAEGLLCRQWLGWERDAAPMQAGVAYLLDAKNKPEWAAGRRNVYAWYYAAQVLHNLGGDDWEKWFQTAGSQIIKHQVRRGSVRDPDKNVRGTWDPNDPPGADLEYADKAGRLYFTCMCVLILETPYRHRPVYPAAEEEAP